LSCKQADALADSLTTNPALALHVHELSVHLAPKTDPCCQKWFTSVTRLIRACELKALNLDADIDFCQPLPFIKTARLQVLRVLSFQTDALRFNAIHYWLAVISDAAGTLEELEIPGFVYEDDSVPLNLRLVPFCPKLRTLTCSNRGVASRHRSPEENTRRNSLYQAIISRHADTLQEIECVSRRPQTYKRSSWDILAQAAHRHILVLEHRGRREPTYQPSRIYPTSHGSISLFKHPSDHIVSV
jgi:hypothetical protein